jgi:hypothetical protein
MCKDRTPSELLNPVMAMELGFCNGLFSGLIASSIGTATLATRFDLKPAFCAPQGVTADQGKKIFLKWMEEHPESLHEDAAAHAFVALMKAFPCPESDKQ